MKKLIFTTIILFIPELVWADSNWDSMVWDQDSWHSNVTFNDSDNDSLPDNWEINYFGDLSHNGTMDDDGDGYTNLLEYRRGTDPTDPNSYPSKAMPWIPLLLLDD